MIFQWLIFYILKNPQTTNHQTIVYKVSFSCKFLLTTLETNHKFCWQGITHAADRCILTKSSCMWWIVGQRTEYWYLMWRFFSSYLLFFRHCICKIPQSFICQLNCCGLSGRKLVHGFSGLFAVEFIAYGFQCSSVFFKASKFFFSYFIWPLNLPLSTSLFKIFSYKTILST